MNPYLNEPLIRPQHVPPRKQTPNWFILLMVASGLAFAFWVAVCTGAVFGSSPQQSQPTKAPTTASIDYFVGPASPSPTGSPTASPTPSPTPQTTAPIVQRTTAPPLRPRTTTPPAERQGVHPGAFCSPEGALGRTVDGVAMSCQLKAGERQARWRGR